MSTETKKQPLTVIIRNTPSAELSLAVHVVEAGLNGEEKFPVVFDFENKDKENRAKKNLLSFAVYETKQGLVVKKVNGAEREKYVTQARK